MTVAVIYRWRVTPGREQDFIDGWAEGTKLIHKQCGSYGARLHRSEDGLFWSYALWPDEETRKTCFSGDITDHSSFKKMRAATKEYFGETVIHPVSDLLDVPPPEPHS